MNIHRKLLTKRALLWLSVLALFCAISVLSGQQGEVSHRLSRGVIRKARILMELPDILRHYSMAWDLSYELILRKTAHFSLFFILAVMLYFAIKSTTGKYVGILTIACCTLFAGIDEYHQIFITGRTACFTDIIIDSAGAVCGLLLVTAAAAIRRQAGNCNKNEING